MRIRYPLLDKKGSKRMRRENSKHRRKRKKRKKIDKIEGGIWTHSIVSVSLLRTHQTMSLLLEQNCILFTENFSVSTAQQLSLSNARRPDALAIELKHPKGEWKTSREGLTSYKTRSLMQIQMWQHL